MVVWKPSLSAGSNAEMLCETNAVRQCALQLVAAKSASVFRLIDSGNISYGVTAKIMQEMALLAFQVGGSQPTLLYSIQQY